MKNLWNEAEAREYESELAQRVYSSRLLGRDKSLVLHGGGNTSVKIRQANIFGEQEDILYVKGSGWDLETIEEAGFSPVNLSYAARLAELPELSDAQMVNELKTHMLRYSAPAPSVEAIMHATIPHKFVDHTHADAIVSVTNTANGEKFAREIYGDRVIYIPYVMPGFDLARLVYHEYERQATSRTEGMVLLKHGIFSFGSSARESYDRMIALVGEAENFLESKEAWAIEYAFAAKKEPDVSPLLKMRKEISDAAGRPMLLTVTRNAKTLDFANRADAPRISQQGPATPDHIIRTKRCPSLGRDIAGFVKSYREYFETYCAQARQPKKMLDAAPRLVLDQEFGLICAGATAKDTAISAEIYDHTIDVILRAERLGGYEALSLKDLFDMEYWELEQAKLAKPGRPSVFEGQVALITGAASGIGRACVQEFMRNGAAVVGLDRDAQVLHVEKSAAYRGVICDLTDSAAIERAFREAAFAFGGVDMLVLNAGIFPEGQKIAQMDAAYWDKVMSININANVHILRIAYEYLRHAQGGGRIVNVGSKNLAAPGPGVSAYSVSKAAMNQLMRVGILEWSADNIRFNSVHPNAVFDTGIWTADVLEARAKHYGLSVDEYKRNNLLKTEITSHDVAQVIAELCKPAFAKTTGAGIPVDGGNERVV